MHLAKHLECVIYAAIEHIDIKNLIVICICFIKNSLTVVIRQFINNYRIMSRFVSGALID